MKDDDRDQRPEFEERTYYFEHERLDCYRLAVEVVGSVESQRLGNANLADQALRAAQSMVLNIAEGCGRTGKSRTHHYRIARGSAAELCAALDLVPGDMQTVQRKLRRVGMMLWAMTK